jgi:hypothetical protein
MTSRIGFIIDNWLPAWTFKAVAKCGLRSLWLGSPRPTPMGIMRFGWLADHVNRIPGNTLQYELYRPGRQYQAIVFLKSFDDDCLHFARRIRHQGGRVIFEINVNYCENSGPSYFKGIGPTPDQTSRALEMTRECDAVITASSWLQQKYGAINANTIWIPDNVNFDIVPPFHDWRRTQGHALPLLWCGQAEKLFELLAIADTLQQYRKHIKLVLMTNNLNYLTRVNEPYRTQLRNLLSLLKVEILPYVDLEGWLQLCAQGGVTISPRFLDNAYNLGHTEWKLALPMSCGRMALASPLKSYARVAELGGGHGLWICHQPDDWSQSLETLLTDHVDWRLEQQTARTVIQKHYSSNVIALQHRDYVQYLLSRRST